MKVIAMNYVPQAEVEFTEAEISVLWRASETHYDGKCRGLSQPGGMLFGLRGRVDLETKTASRLFNWRDIDLFCKVAESPVCEQPLRDKLQEILGLLGKAAEDVNSPVKEEPKTAKSKKKT